MTKRIRRGTAGKKQNLDQRLIGSAYSYYGGATRISGGERTPASLRRVFAAALLSGASILAVGLGGAGAAKAGSCNTIGTTVICSGSFEESQQFTGVEDLTVVLGAGSSIDTTDESSEADFDNAGILVTGEGNISITNNGSIVTGDEGYFIEEYGPYYGGNRHHGIAAYSDEGDATVTNSAQGTIVTTSRHSHGAIAVSGFKDFWGGDATAVNHGLIGTEGDDSYGLVAVAKYTATVDNTGTIVTDGEGSYGIYAYSKYETIVTNSGGVQTWGDYADGIVAISGGAVSVTNSGAIETHGEDSAGIVAGIDWEMSEYSASSSITIANSGSIETSGEESHGITATAGEGSVSVANSGTIETTGEDSHGVSLWGYSVSLDNSGAIVTWGEDAHAVVAHSGGIATTTIGNSGLIGAYGEVADAIVASGPTVRIHNNFIEGEEGEDDEIGVILSEDGAAIRIEESGDARIYNAGYIVGNVKVEADEYGYLSNDGSIYSDRRWKAAVSIDVDEGNAVVVNDGTIRATGRNAEAVKLEGYSVSLANTGDITASGRRGHAVDLEAEGEFGEVTVTNSGLIEASGENADAIRAEGHKVTIANQAVVIPAEGEGDDETVYGIIRSGEKAAIRVDESDYVYVVNNGFIYGNVTIDAEKYASVVTGENSLIRSDRRHVAALGIAVEEGSAHVVNDGAIVTTRSRATGIEVDVNLGDAYVRNNGSVTTGSLDEEGGPEGGWRSHGIDVFAEDTAIVLNTGDVTTYGHKAKAIRVETLEGTAAAINSGTIDTWGEHSTGLSASATHRVHYDGYSYFDISGVAIVANIGSIETRGDEASGATALAEQSAAFALNALGGTIATGGGEAHGLIAASGFESIDEAVEGDWNEEGEGSFAIAVNGLPPQLLGGIGGLGMVEGYGFLDGIADVVMGALPGGEFDPADFRSTIVTTGDEAIGVGAFSNGGTAVAANLYGTVSTGLFDEYGYSISGEGAHGVIAVAEGNALALNAFSSSVTTRGEGANGVSAYAENGDAFAGNKYASSIVTHGDSADGLIAIADSYYEGEDWIGGDAVAINLASSIVTYGDEARGIVAGSNGGEVRAGNISSFAEGEEGEDVAATIVTHGDEAHGIDAWSWEGTVEAVNTGSIATGGEGAYGVRLRGNTVSLQNSGAISTSGDHAHAVVASSNLIATTTVYNSGTIEATGEYAHGILASGPTVNITNTENGSVSSAYGDAIHVFDSKYVSIVNHGDISGDIVVAENEFYGAYTPEVYVLHTGYIDGNITTVAAESDDTIVIDGGRITGAIFTGDGTDEVTVQGEGVELGKGIHAGGEGTAHLTFAHDDEIVLDDGIEGWAISGFNLVDFDSGRVELDGYGIHTAGEEGTVNVAYGAVLATSGEGAHVAAAEVNIEGTLDVGLGGFFNVTGDVTFGGDSLFFTRVQDVTAGVVSGNTVTFLEGSTIFADVTGGIEASVGEDILVASAYEESGVIDYGAVVEDNIFLFRFAKVMNGDIVDTGTADQLFLRVQIEETAFDTAEGAKYTKNQLNIADALDVYLRTQPLSSPLVKWLSKFETEEEQREELLKVIKDTLPEESNGSGIATITSTDLIYDMIMDRLSGGGFAVAQNGDTGVAAGDAQLGGDGKWAIWGRAGVSRAKFTPSGVNGFDADSWGMTIGIDGELAPNLRAGLGTFYLASDVEENGAGANATNDITGYGATAYFSYRPSAWYVNGALGFGTNEYDSRRLSIGGVNVANYDGTQFVARAEAGHMFTSGQWDVTPSVGLRYNRVEMDAYTETGPLPISVDGQTVESLRAVAGVNARYSFLLESGAKLIPEFGVKVLGELADPDQAITGSVVGGGAFTVQSVPRDDVSFGLGAGITWEVSDRFSLRVTYDGELQSDYNEHALAAAVRFAF